MFSYIKEYTGKSLIYKEHTYKYILFMHAILRLDIDAWFNNCAHTYRKITDTAVGMMKMTHMDKAVFLLSKYYKTKLTMNVGPTTANSLAIVMTGFEKLIRNVL